MRTTLRINYDTIAHLYDGQPFREKTVDPELVTFIAQRTFPNRPSILDIACGTGSELVANRSVVPDARLVGLDRSLGMLRQAQTKLGDIAWVQADAAMLPFQPECFDFISCQFAFHHILDKSLTLRAVIERFFDAAGVSSCAISVHRSALTGSIMNISRRLTLSTLRISGLRKRS